MSETRSAWRRVGGVASEYAALALVLAAMAIAFELAIWLRSGRHFLTEPVMLTILNRIPYAIVLAVGMTFVLVIAAIDLSVGSVLALSAAVLGVCLVKAHLSLGVAIAACLGTGLACGALNGAVTIAWRLPSFIVTLGMLEMARGGTYLVTKMETVYLGGKVEAIADISWRGLSLPFFIAMAIVFVGQFVLARTVFGRYLVAIGTNEEAVRLSGIDPRPIKLAVFTLCGLLSAVAAVMHAAKLPSANPGIGQGYELEAIAAAVIGGTSLMGGRGSVVASFFGVLIMAVLSAGLAQLGVPEEQKRLVTGFVIVAAVIVDYYRRRLAKAA